MARPARPDLHDALLEATRSEFAQRGIYRARVEDIARRARASKGAFRSKEETFQDISELLSGRDGGTAPALCASSAPVGELGGRQCCPSVVHGQRQIGPGVAVCCRATAGLWHSSW